MRNETGGQHLIQVGVGGNLTLKHITLEYRGNAGGTSFVTVTGAGAELVLESGVVIQNAKNTGDGLVSVGVGGTLIMNKGIIKDNKGDKAVIDNEGGTFYMNGGTIKDNKGNASDKRIHGVNNYYNGNGNNSNPSNWSKFTMTGG
jgi:hypothetical protein